MTEGPLHFCPHCGTNLESQMHTGRLRPTCPSCGWVHFPDPKVAVAVLIGDSEKVLLVERTYEPHKGSWTLPGGFVDAGEDPKVAAQRECLEETGLLVADLQLVDVLFSQEHPRGASILIVYQAHVKSGILNPGDDASQAAYFPVQQLPPLAFKSTRSIINRLL